MSTTILSLRKDIKMADPIFEAAIAAILKGDADQATEIAKKGLDDGVDPLELMDKGFIPGINQVGDLFETGRLFLPALIYSATAMEKATEIINARRRRCSRYR
jgi:trimethylamine corrinoid protein